VHIHSGHGGGLGDPKDEAPRGKKKTMITAQAEFKKSSDTCSCGTSCLEDVKKLISKFAVNSA
jgi:hypothetical protein